MKFFRLLIILFAVIFSVSNFAQNSGKNNLVVFPLTSTGVYENDLTSAEAIFKFELEKYKEYKILSAEKVREVLGDSECSSEECVFKFAELLDADYAVSCNMLLLGEKIVIQYYLADIDSGKVVLRDQTTSETVEDLETVMKRIAKSISHRKPINANVEVGTITQNEANDILRRATTRNFGISFGYTYPQGGYGSYDKSFTFDIRGGYEMENFATGMLLGIRKGFAMNLYGDYLFSKEDISPYVGGAVGFHWVLNEKRIFSEQKGDGIELAARVGLRAFRTYNFQLIFNLEYTYTFNDFNSEAIVFTIGLL